MFALCSEGPIFRRSYVQKVLCSENICSEGPMFRWYHIQKIICSESPMSEIFVQKVLYSKGPICSKDTIFRNICLESSISRRSYVQKVLYSEDPFYWVLCWNTFSSFSFRYKNISRFVSYITLLFTSSRDTRE